MTLESSQRELQYCFRPHLNRRFEQEVMVAQSPRSVNRGLYNNLEILYRIMVVLQCLLFFKVLVARPIVLSPRTGKTTEDAR
jgi:hypothetical protein